jgi:ABC-2 type transport system ATP-binding protein
MEGQPAGHVRRRPEPHGAGGPVVVATGLVKRWGATTALDGATFTVGRGVTGLLGSNGAGKTTLLGMVLGLHRPDEGSLEVLGLDPTTAGPAIRARLGYSPEHHTLPPDTRAHDLVRHIAEVHGLPHRAATSRASDALWQVGLGEERFRPIGTMSTGQRQRIKLAQAIAHDPALVLLDEPTDGLDPVQRDDMLALIRRIATEYGIDVLLSSHLLEEVERICDAAVILGGGAVVAAGPIRDLTRGGEGVTVEVDGDAEALATWLRARGVAVAAEGSRLVVTLPAADAAADADDAAVGAGLPAGAVLADLPDLHDLVRDGLVATGLGVRRLSDRVISLEDVFLEVGQ